MIVEISPERADAIIEKVSKFIVEKRMAVPAVFAIEMFKPLSFIGSQALYMLEPFAQAFINEKEYQEFAAMLQEQKYVEKLLARIEELDNEVYAEEKKRKKLLKKRRKNKFKKFIKKITKKNTNGGR